MISKIYFALLAASIALMAFVSYYSWSWLHSIGSPIDAIANYGFWDSLSWGLLVVTSLVLIVYGNVILWLSRNAWALWSGFLYFAVFVLLRYFWFDQSLFQFKKTNNLWDGSFSVGPLLGVILVAIVAAIVFCNQLLVVQLQRKMYPPPVEAEPVTETESKEEPPPD